jgi:hypothetical protein
LSQQPEARFFTAASFAVSLHSSHSVEYSVVALRGGHIQDQRDAVNAPLVRSRIHCYAVGRPWPKRGPLDRWRAARKRINPLFTGGI